MTNALAEIVELHPATRAGFAARITDGYNRIYRDILALGAMLAEARNALSVPEFKRMIESDLPFGVRTAYSYMREWAIANVEDAENPVQPVAQLADGYSVRAEIDKLTDDEMSKGLADGKLFQGVSRSQVVEYRRAIRSQHQHRPESNKCPTPSRPERAGALTYSELVYILVEWRRSKRVSQAALDDLIGWGEAQTSKYEIPHADDGRIASWAALGQWMQGLGIGIALVPLG